MCLRAGQNVAEETGISCLYRDSNLGRSTRSLSQCRLGVMERRRMSCSYRDLNPHALGYTAQSVV
jgi:hypothetical protein